MKILHEGKALIVGCETVNLDEFPDLQVIGCNMTSCEHLPLEEMERRGIKLVSLKGETEFLQDITSTAEHTIGLILALVRNYKRALSGRESDRNKLKGYTLSGKTLGIIGYGRVGKQVCEMAMGLGMHVVIYEPNMDWNVVDWALSVDSLCKESDIVSIHIPLSGNEGFFTRKMFEGMRPESYFINTSRSGVIAPGVLKYALENGLIAGAAVDFVDDPELVWYAENHDNLILTPHIGGATFEDMERTEAFITKKVTEYLHEN